jgi:hypothetical protein
MDDVVYDTDKPVKENNEGFIAEPVVDDKVSEPVVENNDEPVKKKSNWLLIIFICILFSSLLALVGWIYYHDGFNKGVASVPDINNSYNSGYSSGYNDGVNYSYTKGYADGTQYGLNASILGLLYYAQNCSVATVNYSGQIYGFVDATCVVELAK